MTYGNEIFSVKSISNTSNQQQQGTLIKHKNSSKEEEIRSPVLGLRILPRITPLHENRSSHRKSDPVTPSIQEFRCKLCHSSFADPVKLASHPCSRIQNVRYYCTECGKSFNCPANLASHRRWHKPRGKQENVKRVRGTTHSRKRASIAAGDTAVAGFEKKARKALDYTCSDCGKSFRSKSYLHGHIASNHSKQTDVDRTGNSTHSSSNKQHLSSMATCHEGHTFTMKSAVDSKFEGLAALAYAAEVHSRIFQTFDRTSETFVKVDGKMHSAQETTNGSLTKKQKTGFEDTAKQTSWLPPSPIRSDLSISPHSVTYDECSDDQVGLNNADDCDAAATPRGYVNQNNVVSRSPAYDFFHNVKSVCNLEQGILPHNSLSMLYNVTHQTLGWGFLKQHSGWNPNQNRFNAF